MRLYITLDQAGSLVRRGLVGVLIGMVLAFPIAYFGGTGLRTLTHTPRPSVPCSYDSRGRLKTEPCRVTPQSAAEEQAIRTKTEAEMSRILHQLQQRNGEAK